MGDYGMIKSTAIHRPVRHLTSQILPCRLIKTMINSIFYDQSQSHKPYSRCKNRILIALVTRLVLSREISIFSHSGIWSVVPYPITLSMIPSYNKIDISSAMALNFRSADLLSRTECVNLSYSVVPNFRNRIWTCFPKKSFRLRLGYVLVFLEPFCKGMAILSFILEITDLLWQNARQWRCLKCLNLINNASVSTSTRFVWAF